MPYVPRTVGVVHHRSDVSRGQATEAVRVLAEVVQTYGIRMPHAGIQPHRLEDTRLLPKD